MGKLLQILSVAALMAGAPAQAADVFDLRFYDVDDEMTAEISNSAFSDALIYSIGFSKDNPYFDFSEYVAPGLNTITIKVVNGSSGWSYGYDFRKNGVSFAADQCGDWNTFGCNNDSYGEGLVYTTQITFDPSVVASVPEPATWAMAIVGMGFVGASLRSRRRTANSSGRFLATAQ